jgi:C1A family cysteine protease
MPKIVHFDHPEGGGRTLKVGACHKDRYDPEHTHYDASQWEPDDLPGFVDLRGHLTPVEDQGDVGSCTANALAGALEYLEKRTNGHEGRVSRLFIYWNERDFEDNTGEDHGAALSDGVKALKEDGACTEATWKYDKHLVFKKPRDEAYEEAADHTIDEAHRVKIDLHHMRHCLAEGYPFVFGLQIYDAFQDDGLHGRIRTPDPETHGHCGAHAMLCVGYSDEDQVFLVRNSWGPRWGDRGYCYIPYDYMANPDYCHDAWTIRRAHNLDFTQGVAGGEPSPHGAKSSFFEDDSSPAEVVASDDLGDGTDTGVAVDADAGDADSADDSDSDENLEGKSEEELQEEIEKLEEELAEMQGDDPPGKKQR